MNDAVNLAVENAHAVSEHVNNYVDLSLGEHLAAVRSGQGLTIEAIADQLKLSPRQITAIESGDYAALPDAATMRGFIRSYARTLKMDVDALMKKLPDDLAQRQPKVAARPLLDAPFSDGSMPWLGRQRNRTQLITGAVFLVLRFALAIFLYRSDALHMIHHVLPESAVTVVEHPLADLAVPVLKTETGLLPKVAPDSAGSASQTSAMPLPESPVSLQADAVKSMPAPGPVAVAAQSQTVLPAPDNMLVFKFRQDSWLQVKRPDGSIVFARLVRAGRDESIEVSGKLSVVIGNAAGVDAQLRGQPLALNVAPGGNVAYLSVQ